MHASRRLRNAGDEYQDPQQHKPQQQQHWQHAGHSLEAAAASTWGGGSKGRRQTWGGSGVPHRRLSLPSDLHTHTALQSAPLSLNGGGVTVGSDGAGGGAGERTVTEGQMTLEAERVKRCKRGCLKVQGVRVRRVERGQRALATLATLLEKVDLEIEAHASVLLQPHLAPNRSSSPHLEAGGGAGGGGAGVGGGGGDGRGGGGEGGAGTGAGGTGGVGGGGDGRGEGDSNAEEVSVRVWTSLVSLGVECDSLEAVCVVLDKLAALSAALSESEHDVTLAPQMRTVRSLQPLSSSRTDRAAPTPPPRVQCQDASSASSCALQASSRASQARGVGGTADVLGSNRETTRGRGSADDGVAGGGGLSRSEGGGQEQHEGWDEGLWSAFVARLGAALLHLSLDVDFEGLEVRWEGSEEVDASREGGGGGSRSAGGAVEACRFTLLLVQVKLACILKATSESGQLNVC